MTFLHPISNKPHSLGDERSVGPWQVLSHLGGGAFGQTWLVRHIHTGQEGALKELRIERLADWKSFELFKREAQVLSRIDFPTIPKLLGASETSEEAPWFVMELRQGRPLSERISRKEPLFHGELLTLTRQALSTLAYLHSQPSPVIHRDIKPANLLWNEAGQLSLIDFGSVRHALMFEGGSTVVGTFGYMAPEQLYGRVTAQSDLYSLGVTLIALATGMEGVNIPRNGLELSLESLFPSSPWLPLFKALTRAEPSQRLVSADKAFALIPKDSDVFNPKLLPKGAQSFHREQRAQPRLNPKSVKKFVPDPSRETVPPGFVPRLDSRHSEPTDMQSSLAYSSSFRKSVAQLKTPQVEGAEFMVPHRSSQMAESTGDMAERTGHTPRADVAASPPETGPSGNEVQKGLSMRTKRWIATGFTFFVMWAVLVLLANIYGK